MEPARPEIIRRLWRSDAAMFGAHLLRLGPQSRHDRFGRAVSDEFLDHYSEGCFGAGDLVFGAFVDGELRGAGELRSEDAIWAERAPVSPRARAEAALSVEEHYRRSGIGQRLFERIMRAAGNHGVDTVEILCQADNRPMRRLAAKFTPELRFHSDAVSGRLIARRPTPYSLWREASQDFADFATAIVDAQMRVLFSRRASEN